MPFIDFMTENLDILELKADQDYRLAKLGQGSVYFQPLGKDADAAMEASWRTMICGAKESSEEVHVKGRTLKVDRTARGAARFTFGALCERALGAADYLALTRRYNTIYLDHIPKMGPESRNEAKRFVTLIDTIYDSRTKLVCSADAEPDDLYPRGDGAFEFERTASRLMEMRTNDYLAAAHETPERKD